MHEGRPSPQVGVGTELNNIVADGFVGTWSELEPIELPDRAALFVHNNLQALRAVWHQRNCARELLIAAESRLDPSLVSDLLESGFDVVSDGGSLIQSAAEECSFEPGRVWLLTSGSTGRPKRVGHTLKTLLTVRSQQPKRTWLNPYVPGAYAWWQVTTLALMHPGNGMVCVDASRPWASTAVENGVDAASGTPTFWRQALLKERKELTEVDFKQVTLGGEPVDQTILDLLADAFPRARVSWIYASSEAGASIAVHDGRAGFPLEWLDSQSDGKPRLSVEGDELLIESPNRGDGVPATLHTGDRVEIRDGRAHIVGRIGPDEINVGGVKVSASKIREALLGHPGIAWAVVKARKAHIVGNLVQASVVLRDAAIAEGDIVRFCAEHLSEPEIPRLVRILEEIPFAESLKSDVQ